MEYTAVTEVGHTGQGSAQSKKWNPRRIILAVTLLLLFLIVSLAIAPISTLFSLYIAAPLAFVVLVLGLYFAYRASKPSSASSVPLTRPDLSSEKPLHSSNLEPERKKISPQPFQGVLKIVSLGDTRTGKTAFYKRYYEDSFTETYTPTTTEHWDTIRKTNLPKLQTWGCPGDKPQPTNNNYYIYDTNGIMVMYDITSRESFEKAKTQIDILKLNALKEYKDFPKIVKIMLVGCKSDLANEDREGQVSTQEAQAFAKGKGFLFAETSAKTGAGVNEAFEALVKAILEPREVSSNLSSVRLT